VTYDIIGEYDGTSYEGEMVRTQHSAGPTESHDTAVITFESMGLTVTVTTETWQTHRVLTSPLGHGELLSIESDIEGEAGGIPFPVSNVVTSFSPPQYIGPFTRWCDGEEWTSPSVTQTVTTTPGGTTSEPTEPTEGEVEGISDSVTTPAGTFDCVHSRIEVTSGSNDGGRAFAWISKELGVLVKEEVYAPGGELIGRLEATAIVVR
jgi:hypothetical protein